MTINNPSSGNNAPGQAGQTQTVLAKDFGVRMASTGGTIVNQTGGGGGGVVGNPVVVPGAQGQPITIGGSVGGPGGLQILNVNNLPRAGGGITAAAGPARNIAPRMIISPQVLNTRPGQTVEAEFSEFLMPNKSSPYGEEEGGVGSVEGLRFDIERTDQSFEDLISSPVFRPKIPSISSPIPDKYAESGGTIMRDEGYQESSVIRFDLKHENEESDLPSIYGEDEECIEILDNSSVGNDKMDRKYNNNETKMNSEESEKLRKSIGEIGIMEEDEEQKNEKGFHTTCSTKFNLDGSVNFSDLIFTSHIKSRESSADEIEKSVEDKDDKVDGGESMQLIDPGGGSNNNNSSNLISSLPASFRRTSSENFSSLFGAERGVQPAAKISPMFQDNNNDVLQSNNDELRICTKFDNSAVDHSGIMKSNLTQFTTDPNLQNQFIMYNESHPVVGQLRSHSANSESTVAVPRQDQGLIHSPSSITYNIVKKQEYMHGANPQDQAVDHSPNQRLSGHVSSPNFCGFSPVFLGESSQLSPKMNPTTVPDERSHSMHGYDAASPCTFPPVAQQYSPGKTSSPTCHSSNQWMTLEENASHSNQRIPRSSQSQYEPRSSPHQAHPASINSFHHYPTAVSPVHIGMQYSRQQRVPYEGNSSAYEIQNHKPIVPSSSSPQSKYRPFNQMANRPNNTMTPNYTFERHSQRLWSVPAPNSQNVCNSNPTFIRPVMPQAQQYYNNGQSNSKSGGISISSGGSHHPTPHHPSGGGGATYPAVCRVPPIRYRYPGPDNYYPQSRYISPNSGSGGGGGRFMSKIISRPTYPIDSYPPNRPHYPIPSPFGQTYRNQYYEGDNFNGYNSNFSSVQQYDDMRRLRTSLTLQALPGLPPGAQGHHLLVKTENGQYQLLRVGMSAPATGTNTVVTTSMSIAQQLPSTPSSSAISVNNSNHVVSAPLISTVPTSTPSTNSQLVGTVVVSTTSTNNATNAATTLSTPSAGPPTTTTVVVTNASSGAKNGTGPSNPSTLPNNPTSPATYRLQSIPSNAANNSTSGVGMASMSMPPQQMYSQQVPQAYSPNSISAYNTANTVSQMTAETAKIKCKNFLSFLLELSAKQNQQVAKNVKGLIQGLVDGKVNEVDFSDRLQKEVNSQPQPCLVGFLKKSLPHLRHSLATNELEIQGIKPPPLSSVVLPAPVTALIPQNQQIRTQNPNMSTPVRIITPMHNNNATPPPYAAPVISPSLPNSAPFIRTIGPTTTQPKVPPAGKTSKGKSGTGSSSFSTVSSPNSSGANSSKPTASKSSAKDKKSFSGSSGYSGDDDINDVAAMGGVNLAEESQKILGSTEFVGTQIRSIRDESFLHAGPLQAKFKSIAAKYGLEEPSAEVATMISHATEERLKTFLEKLAVIAEHRLDVIKMDERYEITQDVKGQLRFLEELEKLERKRHDEQEREMLIRAAKSRSKSEDPEQAKLKAKAKEMQRVALEEMRQREANQTALQAIGPRKKPKLDIQSGSHTTPSQSPVTGIGASSNRQQIMRPRLKRVNVRDVLFLLEQEKDTTRSHFLYKNLLK